MCHARQTVAALNCCGLTKTEEKSIVLNRKKLSKRAFKAMEDPLIWAQLVEQTVHCIVCQRRTWVSFEVAGCFLYVRRSQPWNNKHITMYSLAFSYSLFLGQFASLGPAFDTSYCPVSRSYSCLHKCTAKTLWPRCKTKGCSFACNCSHFPQIVSSIPLVRLRNKSESTWCSNYYVRTVYVSSLAWRALLILLH